MLERKGVGKNVDGIMERFNLRIGEGVGPYGVPEVIVTGGPEIPIHT
jgi:hypothetical protein